MTFDQIKQKARLEWDAFNRLQRPRILIGAATCGRAAGALGIRAAFEKALAEKNIAADFGEVGCLGLCYAEPLADIALPGGRRILFGNLTEAAVPNLVRDFIQGGNPRPDLALAVMGGPAIDGIPDLAHLPMMEGQVRVALRNAGLIDPTNIDHYIAQGGYAGLARALGMTPEAVIEEVKNSGLRGRGGAGFPSATKWALARRSPGDTKYVICNGDEGDPGAFMDRSVLESDPHAVLEGLAIAAYAVGARQAYLYVRAEYPLAIDRLRTAIRQMEELGFAGRNILGSGFSLALTIKEGAGAFVCGEETALMASIEGRRGMPRSRPPFPTDSGLHGKPTVINNVETLANVSDILRQGAARFAQYGTAKSRGTKTFALAGKINRTGLIEVPMGITLKDVIYKIGGGLPQNKKLKGVQTGGPSGGCIPAELIDLPVDYEELAKAGSIMGSGGMIVMDEDSCMVDIARYFLEFTHNESCGKCTPCRMGSRHLLRLLTDITEGKGGPKHIALLEELAQTVKAGSLCGLGQTIPNPVLSTLRYFRHEYVEHIEKKHCPAGVCRALLRYSISDKCVGCQQCFKVCPVGAVSGQKKERHQIDPATCIKCGACFNVCKFNAVEVA